MSILLRTVQALMLAVPFCLASPARAAPISHTFSGYWDTVDPLLSPTFSVGHAFAGSFTYESSTPPIFHNPSTAFYNGITAFSLTTGSYTATLSSPSGVPLSIEIFVGELDCQTFDLHNLNAANGLSGPPVGGFPLVGAAIFLHDCESPLDSAIPLPTVLDFRVGVGNTSALFFGFEGHSLIGELSTLEPAPTIPEPTALALFAVGGGVFAWFRRRKHARPRALFPRVRVGGSK